MLNAAHLLRHIKKLEFATKIAVRRGMRGLPLRLRCGEAAHENIGALPPGKEGSLNQK